MEPPFYQFFFSFPFQVNKIREQCQKQEETIKEQEGELDSRRSELQKLKDEEKSLEKEYDTNLSELQSLSTKLQDTQLQISQVNTNGCCLKSKILFKKNYFLFVRR